jgi:hypothetical protein
MAQAEVMTVQAIWDCGWSRPGYLPNGIATVEYPEGSWVCVRPAGNVVRRAVTEAQCATCPNWQAALPAEE